MIFFATIAVSFVNLTIAQTEKAGFPTDSAGGKKISHGSGTKINGYRNNSLIGIGARLGAPDFAISTVNGYQFSRHYSLGLGVGIHMSVTRCGPGKAGLRVILPRADTR